MTKNASTAIALVRPTNGHPLVRRGEVTAGKLYLLWQWHYGWKYVLYICILNFLDPGLYKPCNRTVCKGSAIHYLHQFLSVFVCEQNNSRVRVDFREI